MLVQRVASALDSERQLLHVKHGLGGSTPISEVCVHISSCMFPQKGVNRERGQPERSQPREERGRRRQNDIEQV